MEDRDHEIRQRAYAIWEREGRPAGKEREHWEQAAQEVEAEQGASGSGPRPASGVGSSSGLEPSGTTPGGSPAAGAGSIGTGGGSTAGAATGSVARKSAGGGKKAVESAEKKAGGAEAKKPAASTAKKSAAPELKKSGRARKND